MKEVIKLSDKTFRCILMTNIRQKEVRNLLRSGIFKIIREKDVQTDSNSLSGIIWITIISSIDEIIKLRARFV